MNNPTSMAPNVVANLATLENLPPLSQLVLKVSVSIMTWEMRARTRRALCAMTAHELADIGISDAAARKEANKRFWQA